MIVDYVERARRSAGTSTEPVYEAVAALLSTRTPDGGTLIDIGCGVGNLWKYVSGMFDRYVGVDAVRYEALPADIEFYECDLESYRIPLPDGVGDVVAGVETIEHLENPRAFARELNRICKPGGLVVITTPNQLSFLSKITLLLKNQFNAFTESSYPAHLTALLEVDLRRISAECGLTNITIQYTGVGRVPGSAWHYPRLLGRAMPRAFSDNVIAIGSKPQPAPQC